MNYKILTKSGDAIYFSNCFLRGRENDKNDIYKEENS